MAQPNCRLAAVVVLALLAGPLVIAQNEQRPIFRGGVEITELEVSVLDRDRRPVRGLTQADFTLTEEGKPLRITQFSEVEFPEREGPLFASQEIAAPDLTSDRFADRRLFALVLDDFSLASGPGGGFAEAGRIIPDVKRVARSFIQSLGPKDFAAVMLTRDPRPFPDFTNMWSKMSATIDAFQPPSDVEAMVLMQTTRGRVGVHATLREAIAYMAKLPQHRKTIVYIGAPPRVDFYRRSENPLADRIQDVIGAARAAGISISGFDVSGRLDRSGAGLLLAMAENTGGQAVGYANLDDGIVQTFVENGSYYLIGFESNAVADGKFRRLDVKVRGNGLTVRARTGYNAPAKPDMVKAEPPPFDAGVEAALATLPDTAEPLALFVRAVAQPGRLVVAAEIAMSRAGQRAWLSGADALVTVTGGGDAAVATVRGRIDAGQRSVSLDVPVPAGMAGPYRVNVTVRGTGEALERSVDVPEGGPWLAPAQVFRAGLSARAPTSAAAELLFRRTERLRVEWLELQALDRRDARLLRRTGQAVASLSTITVNDATGRSVLSVTMPLGTLAPGEYLLEVIVGRGSESDRQLVAFRVIQ